MSSIAKICLLGDGVVGKTTLKNCFAGKGYFANYMPTLGADVLLKTINVEYDENLTQIRLQIWDLAGQPAFKAVRSTFYKGTTGAFLVFDITNAASLYSLEGWLEELYRNSHTICIPLIILGNKIDLRNNMESTVTAESAKNFILSNLKPMVSERKCELNYLEVSAKTGLNVENAFQELGYAILKNFGAQALTASM